MILSVVSFLLNANLSLTNLTDANLSGANRGNANLIGVKGYKPEQFY